MTKQFLLFFLVCLFSTSAAAQVEIGLFGGLSFPLGDYGSTSLDNDDASLASMGPAGSIQFNFIVAEGFFLHAGASVSRNALDTDELEDQTGLSFAENNYTPVYITAGPGFRFTTPSWLIDLAPKAGIAMIGYDNIDATNNFGGRARLSSGTGEGFAYGGSLSIAKKLGRFSVALEGTYLSASIDRNVSASASQPGEGVEVDFFDFEFVPSVLMVGVGLRYEL